MFDLLDESEVQEIHDGLKPLFEEAEAKQLWFYQPHQNLWFTPAELRAEQAKGKWIWGAGNWKLRPPQEELDRLYAIALNTRKAHDLWQTKMSVNGITPDPF